MGQLQAESRGLGTQQLQAWRSGAPWPRLMPVLQAYLDYVALANDAARAAFLRERVGFKPTLAETFKEGPGGLRVFARLFDAVLRVATTCMVGRLYGLSEDLGRTSSGLSKATHLLWLALPLLTRQLLINLHFVCMDRCCPCCAHISHPGQPSCGGSYVTSSCSRKAVARVGRSLCGFSTCNVLLPRLRRTNSTLSRGSKRPRGAGSSRFWRTRRSARPRRAGLRGCFTGRMPATFRPGPL